MHLGSNVAWNIPNFELQILKFQWQFEITEKIAQKENKTFCICGTIKKCVGGRGARTSTHIYLKLFFFFYPMSVPYKAKRIYYKIRRMIRRLGFLFYKKLMESCTWWGCISNIYFLTFLLSKHFMNCDNIFLKV